MEKVFFEIHKGLPKEAPGSIESTSKAFELIPGLPENPKILDIGCGPGLQTIQLANLCNGSFTAVDNHQPFLDELAKNAIKHNLKIDTMNMSMFDLKFEAETFDLIWAEGSIYIIGFEKGLKYWKRFLRQGGFVAITELSWIKDNPPAEIIAYWKEGYPEMKTNEGNLKIVEDCGFKCISNFTLPESDWFDNYYNPMEKRLKDLETKYEKNNDALEVVNMERKEIEMYKKYSDWYGYVFYILEDL